MKLSCALTLATKISGLECPRCTSTAFHKSGRLRGIQRYCCTKCGRTFNETINTPFHGIHDKQKMQDYLQTMHDQKSIRAASKLIGISVPTSFSWRHRILASLKEQTPCAGASPAGIGEITLKHSFKGSRNTENKKMPVTHSLFIADARNIPSIHLLVKTNKTLETALHISNTLRDATKINLAKTKLLSRASKKISHKIMSNKTAAHALAEHVSGSCNNLMQWMARFNGVATKYLQQYWNWYRAESNTSNYENFRIECFGQRQLQQYRKTISH